MRVQKNNNSITKKRTSTVDWLYYHYDKNTGEPFLSDANHVAAEKFNILCEQMIKNYRMSYWGTYIDKGHNKNDMILTGNTRKILYNALQILGNDAALTADIVLKNYSLPMAEKKHKISRGKAKIVLRQALDRLADAFGLHAGYRKIYSDVH